MRVLIVDDEAPARVRLRRLLEAALDVDVVGEARNAAEALERTTELAPDAVFLDVQMPGPSGLDVAASLPEPAPVVVFVTAFDRYALDAFDTAAIDYLLKPVEPDRLARTLQRVRERVTPSRRPAPTNLLIADRGRTHVVPVAEITWLEAADNYVMVHAGARAPLMRRTLAALLDDLGPAFLRVHRSAAVALAQVTAVEPRDKGDATVVLRGDLRVPCSRQYRATLAQRLSER